MPAAWSLDKNVRPHTLELTLRAVVSPNHPSQAVEVWVNGLLQQKPVFKQSEHNRLSIAVPKEAIERGYMTVHLHFPDRVKPKEIGMGDDVRELSIGLESATFR